jgi:hypothetical protein
MLYFGIQTRRNGSTTALVQPALLSGVLIYDDEQNPFTDCIPLKYRVA